LDPRGVGGLDFDPTKGGKTNASVANLLGFGGYHLITKVSSKIEPGKFTTNIDAIWDFSGSPDEAKYRLNGKASKLTRTAENHTNLKERPSEADKNAVAFCQGQITEIVDEALKIYHGSSTEPKFKKISSPEGE